MKVILALYALANILIILYFFIYKQNKADKEYNDKMSSLQQRT